MKTLFAFIFLFLVIDVQSLQAQGFSMFNGRNHPELDWQQAETEHFKIMYPAHLAGIELQTAAIAEDSYEVLSQNLDVVFDKKIRIYLSDEDEILNGFAISPLGFTNIWVHVNDVATSWSGNTKWLRTVVPHELAHLFHGKAIGSKIGLFSYFLGDPMPGFWAEGLAQYETELWDAYRGDRWLRTAILDDRLSYEDGASGWNSRLLYAVGNAQLRFFAEQYGDSTLTKILHHRKRSIFGLVQHHDFFTAFQEVTGDPYRTFYDKWRRHVNVYYNTIAGQMENADSLKTPYLELPGQYYYDIRYSPDTLHTAVYSYASISRPIRRIYVVNNKNEKTKIVAEGSINAPIAWRPDGASIAFSRRTRSKKGTLINDLCIVDKDGKKTKRLTKGRRASSPTFSPDGQVLAFIGSHRGTANVFLLDLSSGIESRLTSFEGDVQLASIEWHHQSNKLIVGRFSRKGTRDVLLLDPETQQLDLVTQGNPDEQFPIWSPDGKHIAITSMDDNVPNVYVVELATNKKTRVTNLITGATAYDWLPPDSTHPAGALIISTAASKQRDRAYRIDAARIPFEKKIEIPTTYASWTSHRPPAEVPQFSAGRSDPIKTRSNYRSLKNMVHLLSFGLPYYNNKEDWGVVAVTSWTEPLGHHTFGFTGSVSIPSFKENSFFLTTYQNNQLRPTLGISGYSSLPTATAYGNEYLLDTVSGAEISIDWPLDIAVQPYTSTRLNLKLQYASISQLNEEVDKPAGLLPPQEGEKAEIQLAFTRKKLRPYSGNVVHPLDGYGMKLQLTASEKLFAGDTAHLEGDIAAYSILPAFSTTRIFLYGRAIAQNGRPFNQDRIGFARFDDIQITAPEFGLLAFSDAVRVRGYRQFVYGNRLLFGTAEYRIPFLPSLQTTLLGLVALKATTLSGFVDGGVVWNNDAVLSKRAGVGLEVKNALVVGGVLQLMHAIGIAQPASSFGTSDDYEIYYRVRASLPF